MSCGCSRQRTRSIMSYGIIQFNKYLALAYLFGYSVAAGVTQVAQGENGELAEIVGGAEAGVCTMRFG